MHTYILLHDRLFDDTDNPVCLVLFDNKPSKDVLIYHDDKKIGSLRALESHLPRPKKSMPLRFNDRRGALGFVSFDNTREASIRFCLAEEIASYPVKGTSRFFIRIGGDFGRDVAGLATEFTERLHQLRDCVSMTCSSRHLRACGKMVFTVGACLLRWRGR